MFSGVEKMVFNVIAGVSALTLLAFSPKVADAYPNVYRDRLIGQEMRILDVKVRDIGGTLIFSDSPEYVRDNGILYSDTVQGDGRVLFYHVNDTYSPKKLAVVIENENDEIINVHISRGHTSQPSSNYMNVGKETQLGYFGKKMDVDLVIYPYRRKILDNVMGNQILWSGQLVYGVYDFYSEKPVKVTVVMCPADTDPAQFVRNAYVLPKDEEKLRGTFYVTDRIITSRKPYDSSKDGVVYIPIGDNYNDKYVKGIDAIDGTEAVNYGNYGILYKFEIDTVPNGSTRYFLNPLGGIYAGAMTVTNSSSNDVALLQTPKNRLYFGDKTILESEEIHRQRIEDGIDYIRRYTEMEDLGVYNNEHKLTFEFSPPGASNLPVNIIMVPNSIL